MKIISNISDIDGVRLYPCKVIGTTQGDVLHFLNTNSFISSEICDDGTHYIRDKGVSAGEVYFSECYKWICKGWKIHLKQDQFFICPFGRICVCIYDSRRDSFSKDSIGYVILGKEDVYSILKIPRGLYYTFFSVDVDISLLCNAPSSPHDINDNQKFSMDDSLFIEQTKFCDELILSLKGRKLQD